ncbi:MAG: hypothetical protein F6K41_32245 [Symploca sp. SIO3E6]|nr:hypothetical protein [Caldora sp. SIO3E6]
MGIPPLSPHTPPASIALKKQGRRQEAGGRRQEGRGFGLFFPDLGGGS